MRFHQFIQVAGVIDQEEADLLCGCGVRFLGFPLRLPVHEEDLSEEEARTIISTLPAGFEAVLITYMHQPEEIISLCDFLGARIVQLHGEISASALERLRRSRPDLAVIKSLIIGLYSNDALLRDLRTFAPFVDAFLTDTHDPDTGAWGATGHTHDWSVSRRLARASSRPLILAGGLSAENVRAAITGAQPAGVDAHTSLEDPGGRKCRHKVEKFLAEASRGFRAMASDRAERRRP